MCVVVVVFLCKNGMRMWHVIWSAFIFQYHCSNHRQKESEQEVHIRIWISLETLFSCITSHRLLLSPNPFYHLTRIIGLASALCGIASAHVPHILTSCTAEMDLTTENENLLSHTHTYTRNDISSDNDDQAHAGQNVCFSPIDLDSVEHARNVCTWYKSKNAMKQFKHCEQKMCKQKKEATTMAHHTYTNWEWNTRKIRRIGWFKKEDE